VGITEDNLCGFSVQAQGAERLSLHPSTLLLQVIYLSPWDPPLKGAGLGIA